MDVTVVGGLLVGIGAVGAAVASYLGKRGENATTRLNSAFDQIQEERDGLRTGLAERDARIVELLQERLDDQVEIARLRIKVLELGGES
ncbi:hypothetical protein ACFWBR_42250 [Streptomyces sp. NPDC060006]|uniref:hypothetical protein n=1 Tax=unclassified Streptomyces TaxID=2593676 RepID=UPI00369B5E4B